MRQKEPFLIPLTIAYWVAMGGLVALLRYWGVWLLVAYVTLFFGFLGAIAAYVVDILEDKGRGGGAGIAALVFWLPSILLVCALALAVVT